MTGMLPLALRTARANLTRSLLSGGAVVLGVAFVCAGLMFTDGLARAMTGQAAAQYRAVDVEVTAQDGRDSTLVDRVRQVDGVRAAEPTWSLTSLGLATKGGGTIRGDHRAVNVSSDPALQPFGVSRGRMPSAPGEVVLDERTATQEHLRTGSQVLISDVDSPARSYTVVGLTPATRDVVTPGALILMTAADLSAVAAYPSTTVIVDAADAVTAEQLATRIEARTGARAVPHRELVRQATDAAVGDAKTFRNVLLGFGVIAVGMAAFVIANTFTIVLAQRTKEMALLRLVGATRRQVFGSVVVEAAVIGLVGSALGLAAGIGLALGLPGALSAAGLSIDAGPVVSVTTVVVALAVGVGVTVLASLLPARRGTRILPVEALSDAAVEVARATGPARRLWGVVLTLAGLATLLGAATGNTTELVFVGTVPAITGFLLLSPVVVPFLIRSVRRPLAALGGAVATLALLNVARNPRRIAATTNALVVGVTLVGTITVLAASAQAPAQRRADRTMFATFLVSADAGVLPPALLDALGRRPELAGAHPNYEMLDSKSELEVRTGRSARRGAAVVSADLGVAPGGRVTVGGREFEVTSSAPGTRTVWLTAQDIATTLHPSFVDDVQVDPAPGTTKAEARAALDAALAAFPTAAVYDRNEYAEHLNARLDQALDVVTALLALAVVIALIGVANTLTLSVVERTRENALLRAVGLTRRGLRLTLATEAVIMALTGTLIGIGASVVITLSALGSIDGDDDGMSLVMPWDRLGVLLAVAVLAALSASVAPTRRANRLPIARTLAAEV
jgi:putative ABC transport system permease protein